jgi:hypothetical protein
MSNEARKLAENYSLSNNVNKVLEVFKGTIRGKHKG